MGLSTPMANSLEIIAFYPVKQLIGINLHIYWSQ